MQNVTEIKNLKSNVKSSLNKNYGYYGIQTLGYTLGQLSVFLLRCLACQETAITAFNQIQLSRNNDRILKLAGRWLNQRLGTHFAISFIKQKTYLDDRTTSSSWVHSLAKAKRINQSITSCLGSVTEKGDQMRHKNID